MNIFEFIKSKVSILDVVQEYVTLKPAGKYWKGPSPFRHERVPSFTVSPHKEIYYCFSSGQGGDVISFIAQVENCSQLEAAQHLIDRYKLQIPKTIEWKKAEGDTTKKSAYEKTCDFFAQWCHNHLQKSHSALTYLQQRSVTPPIIERFKIGYCPVGQEPLKELIAQARKENILLQDFLEAQILMEGRQGAYSPFEDRIIFPIYNHLDACCGFGGRVYKATDTRAKYYNSHEHAYFNKSTILFGISAAKKALQSSGAAFLVEGYLDCIAMVQAGFTNTIATLGTACTLDHLKHISRYAKKLYVMYDGDDAGQKAMLRLADLCWQVNLDLFIISLPPTEDPSSFLSKKLDLEPYIKNAPDIFIFFIEHMNKQFFNKSLQERLNAINQILDTIMMLPDQLKKDLLLHKVATTFDTPIETLKMHMHKKKVPLSKTEDSAHSSNKNILLEELSPLEKKLFSAILNRSIPLEQEDMLFLIQHVSAPLAHLLQKYLDKEYHFDAFFNVLSEQEQQLVSTLALEFEYDETNGVVEKLLEEFYKRVWKLHVHSIKIKLANSHNLSSEEQAKILTEFQELKKNIKRKSQGVV